MKNFQKTSQDSLETYTLAPGLSGSISDDTQ